MKTQWYEASQNNSGGSFVVNEVLCHRLFIEAESAEQASNIAQKLGVYYDGCRNGMDCNCCGDRWYEPDKVPDLTKMEVSVTGYKGEDQVTLLEKWLAKYGNLPRKDGEDFKFDKKSYCTTLSHKVSHTIESYAQWLADEYGWTTPDVRLFYLDGTVKEIFKQTKEEEE